MEGWMDKFSHLPPGAATRHPKWDDDRVEGR
jgi:hypothetical protein